MEHTVICVYCKGLANPPFKCSVCHTMVCEQCFDHELGMCRKCQENIRPDKKKGLKDKLKTI